MVETVRHPVPVQFSPPQPLGRLVLRLLPQNRSKIRLTCYRGGLALANNPFLVLPLAAEDFLCPPTVTQTKQFSGKTSHTEQRAPLVVSTELPF
jgi:hypothetical protein